MLARKISLFELVVDRLLNAVGTVMRRRASRKQRFKNIAIPADDLIGIRLFTTGSFEQTQLDGVLRYVSAQAYPDDAVMIDVGANIGVYSIALSEHFSKVYAFEANRLTSDILKANLELSNTENAVPVNLALSDEAGRSQIHVPVNGNLGWATLNADECDTPVRPVDITCEKLDRFLDENGVDPKAIKLMKIDVEGHELQVLKGAEAVLRETRPTLLCEVLSAAKGSDLVTYLKKFGYTEFYTFKRSYKNIFDATVDLVSVNEADLGHDALVLVK